MSKSLKKLIDINRLREFKNKLVRMGSAYVQTGAVDQTVAGTKTFSEPIVGSVTGSSGSCTGNAATATNAGAVSTSVASDSTKDLVYATMADNDFCRIRCGGTSNAGYLEIATSDDGNEPIYVRQFNGVFGSVVRTLTLLDENGNTQLPGTVTAPTFSGNLNGNADTANIATKATQDSDGNKITTTYSKNGHTHDDRYYTENEVNNLLNGKANTSGTYSNLTVGKADSATKAANADHATKADSATRATSADRASATDFVQDHSGYHAIRFDWSSQVPGHVGLRVDVTDMGGIITTDGLVSDIRAQWYAAYPDGPEAHNAMWGGRDITAAFDDGSFSASVADGTFKDIFPGDYITKSVTISGKTYDVTWVVADCDYWINKGDPAMTAHHVVIVPQAPIFDANMNPTNTTEGGYAGSAMYKNVIPACAAGIVNAFGSGHILTFRDLITNTVDNKVASRGYCGWTGASAPWEVWASVQCNLMTEHMVTGAPHFSSSGLDDEITTRQMSAFRLSGRLINYNRWTYWLRNVVNSACFAGVNGIGNAFLYNASDVYGVRPFALLR